MADMTSKLKIVVGVIIFLGAVPGVSSEYFSSMEACLSSCDEGKCIDHGVGIAQEGRYQCYMNGPDNDFAHHVPDEAMVTARPPSNPTLPVTPRANLATTPNQIIIHENSEDDVTSTPNQIIIHENSEDDVTSTTPGTYQKLITKFPDIPFWNVVSAAIGCSVLVAVLCTTILCVQWRHSKKMDGIIKGHEQLEQILKERRGPHCNVNMNGINGRLNPLEGQNGTGPAIVTQPANAEDTDNLSQVTAV